METVDKIKANRHRECSQLDVRTCFLLPSAPSLSSFPLLWIWRPLVVNSGATDCSGTEVELKVESFGLQPSEDEPNSPTWTSGMQMRDRRHKKSPSKFLASPASSACTAKPRQGGNLIKPASVNQEIPRISRLLRNASDCCYLEKHLVSYDIGDNVRSHAAGAFT